MLSLWNKKGVGLSWLDFVLLCSEEPSYIPQYQDILRSLKNKKLVRLSTLLKAYVEEEADQGDLEEPEEEVEGEYGEEEKATEVQPQVE